LSRRKKPLFALSESRSGLKDVFLGFFKKSFSPPFQREERQSLPSFPTLNFCETKARPRTSKARSGFDKRRGRLSG
jgi:hypothetical protein